MHSFIYFYSKFTEEFLLLGGAGIFTLLSAYCYHWVIKRRRLGAARSQVPSGVVKAYLNQLINEAQFVRTQLFGLLGNDVDPTKIQNLFMNRGAEAGAVPAGDGTAAFSGNPEALIASANFSGATTGSVPTDLLERLKALEGQLAQKESLVVNINVEKTRLLEEIENLKQNQKALQNSNAMSAGQDELLKKIKNLEERLEEYALFEDDLANLKRLQQENNTLKKRLEDNGMSATVIPASPAEPIVETVIPAGAPTPKEEKQTVEGAKKASLDKNTVESLLNGESPIATAEPKVDPVPQAAAPAAAAAPKEDNFEKLVDSVENSLGKQGVPSPTLAAVPSPTDTAPTAPAAAKPGPAKPEAKAAAPAPAATKAADAATPAPTAPAAASTPTSEKSDEELLKEFENLLNS